MAQINSCLKRIFIGFNLLFAIIGVILISLAMLSQIVTSDEQGPVVENRTTGLVVLYVVGAGTVLIALLGASGAYREHKVSLIVFLVLMIIAALLMIRAGVPSAILRPQLEEILEDRFRSLLPLNEAPPDVKSLADKLQLQLHCCGLFSSDDWRNQFPDSCLCPPMEEEEYECKRVLYEQFQFFSQVESRSIYSRPCFPIIMYYSLLGANIVIGFFFTLASLAVLGMILSSIMIHQLRHPERTTVLFTVPTIFTPNLPKYQELHNTPPKYEELQSPPPAY
ncbi:tetraspanin-6 [Nematolebias whitei]|uniref:tetraspanin-6 n=1 Tax=Nematolebias whitei TaxID=451745 RepID=UPI00189B738C|nr:tetraspanin-6 [Nematolebias whitei]